MMLSRWDRLTFSVLSQPPLQPKVTGHFTGLIEIFFFFPCCMGFRILLPRPRIELMPPAVEVQIANSWTTREVS